MDHHQIGQHSITLVPPSQHGDQMGSLQPGRSFVVARECGCPGALLDRPWEAEGDPGEASMERRSLGWRRPGRVAGSRRRSGPDRQRRRVGLHRFVQRSDERGRGGRGGKWLRRGGALDRVVLAICREYAQPPVWFYQLQHSERLVLLADWRIRHQAETPRSTKSGRAFWTSSDG
jgi:hypothetical protein